MQSRKTDLENILEDLAGTLLAVWFFGKVTTELTMLGTSLHFAAVLIFQACRICGLLALSLMVVLAVRDGTFFMKRTWIILGLGILSALGGAQTWLMELAVLLVGLRNFNMEKVFRKLFISLVLGTVFIFLLGASGIIVSDTYEREDGTIRLAFGFYHPNVLGMRFFQICAMNLFLREEKGIRFTDAVLCIFLGLFVLKTAHSRTSMLLLFGLGVLALVVMAANAELGRSQGPRPVSKLMRLGPAAAFLVPAGAVFGFLWLWRNADSSLFDSTVWSRISQSAAYLQAYGLSFRGRGLYYLSGTLRSGVERLVTLDNGYMYLLLGFGVPAFIALMAGQALLIVKTTLEKRWMLLVILILYMGYLMMETSPLRADCNFFLLLLGDVLWMQKSEETEEKLEYIIDRA